MAHTPGPWVVYQTEWQDWPGVDAGFRTIVIWGDKDEDDDAGVRGDSYEEALANARLIAAAPELLEALETLLSQFCNATDSAPSDWLPRSGAGRARAAIAKARGQ